MFLRKCTQDVIHNFLKINRAGRNDEIMMSVGKQKKYEKKKRSWSSDNKMLTFTPVFRSS